VTEKNLFYVAEKLKEGLEACVPLAIIGSTRVNLPQPFLDKIIKELNSNFHIIPGRVEDKAAGWERKASVLYPNISIEDITFRSTQDPEIRAILEYVYKQKLPVAFCTNLKNGESHATGLKLIKEKSKLKAKLICKPMKFAPTIDVETLKIEKDLDKWGETFFDDISYLAIFPPSKEIDCQRC
jgi:hypothetical protein